MNPANQIGQNRITLGPGLRNICDKLINEINSAVFKMVDSKKDQDSKKNEFRSSIKTNFYKYLIKIRKTMISIKNLQMNDQVIRTLDNYYFVFENILSQLDFVNKLSELYFFPKFDINDSLDLIFNGCTNNLRQKLVKDNLFYLISSKNLYDNNDLSFLVNNDLNNVDYNKEKNNNEDNNKILMNRDNPITKRVIDYLNKKIDEFNNYINLNKNDYNNNFKIILDDNISLQIYDNFIIQFILVQEKFNLNKYFILPVEISYNNEKININDKEEIFIDKNKCLKDSDLQYFISKFKPNLRSKKNIEEIEKFTIEDFFEKCLLFKEYTKELFNKKFETLKQNISDCIKKIDIPVSIQENINNMEIEEGKNDNNDNNDIDIITLNFNFILTMKEQNNFYLKLVYNKNYPTIIKMVYYQNNYFNNNPNNRNNIYDISNIYMKPVEKIILFNLKEIKSQIEKCYIDYKQMLTIWLYKKLKYLYPMFFDFEFKIYDNLIIFKLKPPLSQTIFSEKLFSISINDLGKLTYNNLYTSKLFYDNFKEINNIIMNFIKSIKDENDSEEDECIYNFNKYINKIIFEKMYTFQGCKNKLLELNDKNILLRIYNSYYSDKNISVYFDMKFNIIESNNFIKYINLKEIQLITLNNYNMNKKIVLNCFDNNNIYLNKKIEFNSYYNYLCTLVSDLNNKYELYMLYTFEIINLSENPNSIFELNECIEITNNKSKNKDEDYYELSFEKNNMNIFKQQYKENLSKYFYKIKFYKENNVFQFYLKPEIFKNKYKNILKFPIDNYSLMFQYYIFGYDYKEDFISIIILSKLKIGYMDIIQMVFEVYLPKLLKYMNSIFKLIDYLSINNNPPVMTACPLFLTLQLRYVDKFRNIDFQKHINFKIIDKEPFYAADGNFNSVFVSFVKDFGNEIMMGQYDHNNKDFLKNKIKYFYLAYNIYDLFLNEFNFKFSLVNYPYNHFKQNSSNIYFFNKDFNFLELFSLSGTLLVIQIRHDNSLFIEFKNNINLGIDGSNIINGDNNLQIFVGEINKFHFNLKKEIDTDSGEMKIIIDDNDNEKISLIDKLKKIVNIFVKISNLK